MTPQHKAMQQAPEDKNRDKFFVDTTMTPQVATLRITDLIASEVNLTIEQVEKWAIDYSVEEIREFQGEVIERILHTEMIRKEDLLSFLTTLKK